MPTLETPRLILKVPTLADLDGWAALDGDPEATRFIGGVQSRERAQAGIRRVLAMWDELGHSLFSVFEKDTGRWLGRTGPWVPEDALGNEVGWAFLPAAQGRGYATEAAGAAVAWAFEGLGWDEVIHCIHAPNLASIAVARNWALAGCVRRDWAAARPSRSTARRAPPSPPGRASGSCRPPPR